MGPGGIVSSLVINRYTLSVTGAQYVTLRIMTPLDEPTSSSEITPMLFESLRSILFIPMIVNAELLFSRVRIYSCGVYSVTLQRNLIPKQNP